MVRWPQTLLSMREVIARVKNPIVKKDNLEEGLQTGSPAITICDSSAGRTRVRTRNPSHPGRVRGIVGGGGW